MRRWVGRALIVVFLATAVGIGVWRGRPAQPEVQAVPLEEPVTFRRLAMVSSTEGWALDEENRILRADGGPERWVRVTPEGVTPDEALRVAFAFLDAERAWVAFGAGGPDAGPFQVAFTADAGETWQTRGPIPVGGYTGGEALGAIQLIFADDQHGWFLGQVHPGMHGVEPFLFATADGGRSWQLVMQTRPTDEAPASEKAFKGSYSTPYGPEVLAFVSPSRGLAGTGSLAVTTDGGHTWEAVDLPDPPDPPELAEPFGYVRPPRFTSEEHGYVLADLYEYEDVACPPCDRFLAPPKATYLYVTEDQGESWQVCPCPHPGATVVFRDAQHGWLLAPTREQEGETQSPALFGTDDGGRSWEPLAEAVPFTAQAQLSLLDGERGLAWEPEPAQGKPALFVTQDGGQTWEPLEPRLVTLEAGAGEASRSGEG